MTSITQTISQIEALHPPLLSMVDLTRHFDVSGGLLGRNKAPLRAVDGISIDIRAGETLSLVGESGCGKSTLGRLLARLLPATSGQVIFEGQDMLNLRGAKLMAMRRQIQSVFQDPFGSLNPRMTAGEIVAEPLVIHRLGTRAERRTRVAELLDLVGLRPEQANRLPHEFSGGQRQRLGIARALALNPKLVILDEPVSALDVSIQAQILNLLERLQKELGLTYLFVSHDLSVVQHIADRVAVMYMGKIVEIADNESFYARPKHPYSMALLSASPVPDPTARRERIILQGDLPSPAALPQGCRFQTRCAHATDKCRAAPEPPLEQVGNTHMARCWHLDDIHTTVQPKRANQD